MNEHELEILEEALQLARALVTQLAVIEPDADSGSVLAVRLAHAHALGLVDALIEATGRGAGLAPEASNTERSSAREPRR
jgi:hypothetical protein